MINHRQYATYWCRWNNVGFIQKYLYFEPLLVGEWAWPPCAPLIVWSLQTQPKSWPTGWSFWAKRYLEIMFSIFSSLNPLLKQFCGLKIGKSSELRLFWAIFLSSARHLMLQYPTSCHRVLNPSSPLAQWLVRALHGRKMSNNLFERNLTSFIRSPSR